MSSHPPILIIGAGIGGLCTAIALQKQGFPVQVYEKVPELRGLGAGLILATNAMKALKAIGIVEEIQEIGYELTRFSLLAEDGKVLNAGIDAERLKKRYGFGSYAVHRADLHNKLISLLKEGSLHTGKACKRVGQSEESSWVEFEDGSRAEGIAMVASDGIHSVIRQQHLPGVNLRYSGYTCWRAIIDASNLEEQEDLASETWGKNGRFGIVPLSNNRIYWFATKNAPENDAEMAKWKLEDLKQNFSGFHDKVQHVLAQTKEEDLLWNDIHDFKPLETYAFERILLLGDAAHATTPNMGQGACMAIEDAAVLRSCLKTAESYISAFEEFEVRRMERNKWIVNTSYRIGAMGQWSNGLMSRFRNRLMRMTPQSTTDRQMTKLFDIKF
ncbi:MAG: FAD-dependent monooxygenase [Bacteroidia bacterium]|nr:FAD-dependent monooxygenase [Bacteroidia bacterium]